MVSVTGELNGDGKPVITDLNGANADRIRTDLDKWDTLHLELTNAIIKEIADGVRTDRESFEIDEAVELDCTRRYDSNYDYPGIELEEFSDGLESRVIEMYNRDDLSHDREWHGWQATATAIEKPDRTIQLRSETGETDETEQSASDAAAEELVERTVRLRMDQAEWIDDQYIDLSEFLRDKLDELRES